MTKESVLKGISESGVFGLKVVGMIFVVVGILINIFLGLIIVGKLYGSEIALPIANGIQIIFNALFYITLILAIIALAAEILLSLVKYDKKFREKRKEKFKEFIEGIIKKSGRNK